jgi:hypothetical protein
LSIHDLRGGALSSWGVSCHASGVLGAIARSAMEAGTAGALGSTLSVDGWTASLCGSTPVAMPAGVFFLKKLNIEWVCGVIAFYETHWHFFSFESFGGLVVYGRYADRVQLRPGG